MLFSLLARRLLWIPPTLFFVSVTSFLVLSFVPSVEGGEGERELEALPRFVNPTPRDVRSRSLEALAELEDGGLGAAAAEAELVRLGGAALPHVVPRLDGYPPDTRARIAVALAPIARRMDLEDAELAYDPKTAAAFWSRMWEARSVEFRPATARTAVERLTRYRTPARARELAKLDTYALPTLFERLEAPERPDQVPITRTLVDAIADVTGLGARVDEDASVDEARAVVGKYRAYWLTHESHFRSYEGGARAIAMIRETRYGKWGTSAAYALRGETREAADHLGRVRRAAPVTLALLLGGIVVAHLTGVALGTLAAIARGRAVDYGVSAVVLTLYALPTAALAAWLERLGGAGLWLPMALVAAGLVAAPTRHQRAALAQLLEGEVVRAARARGASRLRASTAHGLRSAVANVTALISVEPPMALSAVFVVEHVFAIEGLGAMTLDAVVERDVGYLMGLSMGAATLAVLVVLASDVAQSLLDPRQRAKILGGR